MSGHDHIYVPDEDAVTFALWRGGYTGCDTAYVCSVCGRRQTMCNDFLRVQAPFSTQTPASASTHLTGATLDLR